MNKKQLTITLSVIAGVLVLILVIALVIRSCNKKDVLVPTETTTTAEETTTTEATTESETEPPITTEEGEVIIGPAQADFIRRQRRDRITLRSGRPDLTDQTTTTLNKPRSIQDGAFICCLYEGCGK